MTSFWRQSAAGRLHCVIVVTFQGASEVRVLSLESGALSRDMVMTFDDASEV